MVLKPDQERVKKMIKETLTLLCKNGLSFDLHFSIEALIGVTLDDKDVFLVNINELVKSDKAQECEASSGEQSIRAFSDEGSEDDQDASKHSEPSRNHKRKRRKRMSIKHEHDDSSNDDKLVAKEQNDENQTDIKKEGENDSGSDQNVIVIKEEVDDCWNESSTQDNGSFGQYANMPGTSHDQNFSSLSDMSLLPVGSQDSNQVWSQAAAYTSTGTMVPTVSRSSTGSQLDPSQEVMDELGRKRYRCKLCGSLYSSRSNLFAHERLHAGRYPYYCPVCKKGCGSTTYLRNHLSSNHGMRLEFKCQCGKAFDNMKLLKEHAQMFGHIHPYEGRRVERTKSWIRAGRMQYTGAQITGEKKDG